MQNGNNDIWESALKPFTPLGSPISVGQLTIGDGTLALIAGPCSIESESLCLSVGEQLAALCQDLRIPYIFKSSFDKANRTSATSFRGNGIDQGLTVLRKVKEQIGVPVVTDVHESDQVPAVAEVADVVQIPAFLCRQTDLLVASGDSGRAVNIKKGQFLPPEDMEFAIGKVTGTGNQKVMTCERGASFGYRDLVVDMRNLVIMRSWGYPVVFDATHSVQQMGASGGATGGRPGFIPAQVRAAAAVGIDALFMETHPDPVHALSDGSNMLPLGHMRTVLEMALAIHSTHAISVP
ncbi:MAG: 3-deoxy-8-phosphooctulonate synthase [SAR202 cluster bacterium]|nr:3-deoxy-8-phosphooctulonate synthase [Gemmatimonadota bacterium]MQF94411.1 3-deoxy-8-phosphooctulonate synthase [SAR202 cluster bacterium]|tara:strand:- start:3716 stop:4597 length:882 start_codon:yes stop_codon:yes gene_type:complete